MSYKQCVLPRASQNPDEPGFEIREAGVPQELTDNKVLIKVLVSAVSFRFACVIFAEASLACSVACDVDRANTSTCIVALGLTKQQSNHWMVSGGERSGLGVHRQV